MLFSLGPALKATKADLVNDLKQQIGEPAHLGRLNRPLLRRAPTPRHGADLALLLLFGAGLFLRGALKSQSASYLGFEHRDNIVTEMDFTLANTDEAAAKRLMFAAVQRVRELPGSASRASRPWSLTGTGPMPSA